MQTYYDQIMLKVGEPFAIPNPAGDQENNLLITHSQGVNLAIYSNNVPYDLSQLDQPLSVYWAVHNAIPFLVVLIGEEETGAAFLWSMNSYSIPEERFESWLAAANNVGLWLIDNATGLLTAGRILSPLMSDAMMKMLKPHLQGQRQRYYDAEAVSMSVDSMLDTYTTIGLINALTEFAIQNGTWYTDKLPPLPKPKNPSGLIKLDASNNYGADILAEYNSRLSKL